VNEQKHYLVNSMVNVYSPRVFISLNDINGLGT